MKYFIGEENFPIYVHLVISSHRIVDIHLKLFIFKRIYINVQIKIELIFQIFLHLYLHFLDINSFYFLFLIRVISTYAVASKKIKYRAQEERVHDNPILKI